MTDRDKFEQMCAYYMSLMDGDTHRIEDAFDLMKKEKVIDEDGEWIDHNEEEGCDGLAMPFYKKEVKE